jgi:hypothetical protein
MEKLAMNERTQSNSAVDITVAVRVKNESSHDIGVGYFPDYDDQVFYVNGHRISQPANDLPYIVEAGKTAMITEDWNTGWEAADNFLGVTFSGQFMPIGQDKKGLLFINDEDSDDSGRKFQYSLTKQKPWSMTIVFKDA